MQQQQGQRRSGGGGDRLILGNTHLPPALPPPPPLSFVQSAPRGFRSLPPVASSDLRCRPPAPDGYTHVGEATAPWPRRQQVSLASPTGASISTPNPAEATKRAATAPRPRRQQVALASPAAEGELAPSSASEGSKPLLRRTFTKGMIERSRSQLQLAVAARGTGGHGDHAPPGRGTGGGGGRRASAALADILTMAVRAKRSHYFHEERHGAEQDEEVSSRYWLTNSLLQRAVLHRDGAESWEARTVRFLQSARVQWVLIFLLLLDVLIVFAELFLESEHPGCRVLRRRSYSCCAPADAATAFRALLADGGSGGGSGGGSLRACAAPSQAAAEFPVGCVAVGWAHLAHEGFSVGSLLILAVFQMEIVGLIAAFRGLFLRSKGYLSDVVVVSLSLGLQYYVLMVELGLAGRSTVHGGGGGGGGGGGLQSEEELAMALEELQSVILFARTWRFIRVGHGIATSMHDMVSATRLELHGSIDELRTALRSLEDDIPVGSKPRQRLTDVHRALTGLLKKVSAPLRDRACCTGARTLYRDLKSPYTLWRAPSRRPRPTSATLRQPPASH